jgi:hypothetical protein
VNLRSPVHLSGPLQPTVTATDVTKPRRAVHLAQVSNEDVPAFRLLTGICEPSAIGLEISPDQRRLLIGFRSPLRDGRALIACVENLAAMFDSGAQTAARAFASRTGSWRPRHPRFVACPRAEALGVTARTARRDLEKPRMLLANQLRR